MTADNREFLRQVPHLGKNEHRILFSAESEIAVGVGSGTKRVIILYTDSYARQRLRRFMRIVYPSAYKIGAVFRQGGGRQALIRLCFFFWDNGHLVSHNAVAEASI